MHEKWVTVMQIRCEVIDITRDTPRRNDHLLVDTNVWFRVAYDNAHRVSDALQNVRYQRYLDTVARWRGHLYRSLLSFGELVHSIEHNEWLYFMEVQQLDISFKDFRRDPALHQQTIEIVRKVWLFAELVTGEDYLPALVDLEAVQAMDAQLDDLALDGYDLLMLHAMHAADLTQLLTDDADFGQVPDIQVFTANPYLIQQATQQGRLIARPKE